MEYISTLSIDIETYSSEELKKTGVYKYAASPDFEILLLTFSYDDGPEICIDLTRNNLPESLKHDILNRYILKTAYNAAFEITCLSAYIGVQLDPYICAETCYFKSSIICRL